MKKKKTAGKKVAPAGAGRSFVSGLAEAPELKRSLQFVDRVEVRKAAGRVAEWVNALHELQTYKATLASVKRKEGLPPSVELAYHRALNRFVSSDMRRGIDAVRSGLDQLELSGLNLVVSRHIQSAIVKGELPVGRICAQASELLSRGSVDYATPLANIGLAPDLIEQLPPVLAGPVNPVLSVDLVDNPQELLNKLRELLGHGISHGHNFTLDGGGGGSTGVHIPITKGFDLLVQDFLYVFETHFEFAAQTSVVGGVPTSGSASGTGAVASPIEGGMSSDEAGLFWGTIGMLAVLVGLVSGVGWLVGVGVTLTIFAVGLLASAAGFVDP